MSVCLHARLLGLHVCSDLEPKLLEGFQPTLAWATPWYLKVTSKYFFGLTPPPPRRGYNFGQTKKPKLAPCGPYGGLNPFAAPFAAPFARPSGARPVSGLSTGWFYRAAKRPAPS